MTEFCSHTIINICLRNHRQKALWLLANCGCGWTSLYSWWWIKERSQTTNVVVNWSNSSIRFRVVQFNHRRVKWKSRLTLLLLVRGRNRIRFCSYYLNARLTVGSDLCAKFKWREMNVARFVSTSNIDHMSTRAHSVAHCFVGTST